MTEQSTQIHPVLPLRDIVVFPHMIVPLFVGREKSVKALEEVMAGLEGPVILSGDFNMMPWGHSVRRLTRAADVRRAGPLLFRFQQPRERACRHQKNVLFHFLQSSS